MRDPNAIACKTYEMEDPPTVIQLHDIPVYNLYDYDLNDEKSFKQYIKDIESIVRTSFEYRALIKYLKEYVDMDKCAFYENLSNADNSKIRIEIHHEPLSLYDIAIIVYNKRVSFNEPLDEEMVAKEVMYLHYDLMVGLIPLAETVHQLVHAQYLFVPTTAVYGKYREFVSRYEPYMLPEQIEVLNHIEEATKVYTGEDAQTILSKQFIYIDASGTYNLPKMEDIVALLRGRIKELVDNE